MSNHTNPELPEDVELSKLVQEELVHLLDDSSTDNTKEQENVSSFNIYFDKQLTHLVIEEEFNFKNISAILSEVFKNDKIDTSERICKQRWAYLHRNRNRMSQLKEKQKQNKRIKSVAAFSNPYSLYSVDELIQNLQQQQKQKQANNQVTQKIQEPTPKGYNIMKDSFRKISNLQQYKELQAKMKQALRKAQEQVFEDMPLYYTPQYGKAEQFEVRKEELTAEKAKQIMTYQIQMQKIGRELTQKKELQQQEKYESLIKKRVQKEQRMMQNTEKGNIEQDWDQYESD